MRHDSILTSLAQLERLIRKGLSMGGRDQEELDAYMVALREAVEGYLYAIENSRGMAIPPSLTKRFFVEHE